MAPGAGRSRLRRAAFLPRRHPGARAEFTTDQGVASVIDFMPVRSGRPDLVRIVVGRRGQVPMRLDLAIRFDYGSVAPWVRSHPRGISAIAGPDSLLLRTAVPLRGERLRTVADFVVSPGQRRLAKDRQSRKVPFGGDVASRASNSST